MTGAKSRSGKDDAGRLLTGEEFLAGGSEPYRRLEMRSIRKPDGRPGVVYIKVPTAAEAIRFADFKDLDAERQITVLIPVMARALVTPDGKPLLTEEQAARLSEVRSDAFIELSNAVTSMMQEVTGGELGEASGEASGFASPTG